MFLINFFDDIYLLNCFDVDSSSVREKNSSVHLEAERTDFEAFGIFGFGLAILTFKVETVSGFLQRFCILSAILLKNNKEY